MFTDISSVQNKKLFEKKSSLLKNIDPSQTSSPYLDFYFHDIPFRFYTKDHNFINELKDYLPQSWQKEDQHPIEVYHQTPNISINEWDEEACQDCFISEDGNHIIQRDFLAKRINDQKYNVFFIPTLKDDGFFNFLRWFLPPHLLKQNRFLFHCSSVVTNTGKANIFLGHSGAGKTTICQLAGKRKIINDDMNIIEFKDNKAFVRTGGIGGAFDTKSKQLEEVFELQQFYWLKQSSLDQINPLNPAKAYTKVMASFANISWNFLSPVQEKKLTEISETLVQNFSFAELEFLKATSVWETIDP